MEKNDWFSMDSALLKIEKLSDATSFLLDGKKDDERQVAIFLIEITLKTAINNQLENTK